MNLEQSEVFGENPGVQGETLMLFYLKGKEAGKGGLPQL